MPLPARETLNVAKRDWLSWQPSSTGSPSLCGDKKMMLYHSPIHLRTYARYHTHSYNSNTTLVIVRHGYDTRLQSCKMLMNNCHFQYENEN